jgi:hypothetical protein
MLARWLRRFRRRVTIDLDVFTPSDRRAVMISWR